MVVSNDEFSVATSEDGTADFASETEVIRVVICWLEASGYMAACWKALTARPGIKLHVLHVQRNAEKAPPYNMEILDGVSHEFFNPGQSNVDDLVLRAVECYAPDVIVLCGWSYRPYVNLVYAPQLAGSRFLLGMDSRWRGTLYQHTAKVRLRRLVRRLDGVIVTGALAREYARRIGVPESSIFTGYYGFDFESFRSVDDLPETSFPHARRRFLFVGRYAKEKAPDVLASAYNRYRSRAEDPWELTCCGSGDQASYFSGVVGITDEGFIQPCDLPMVFARHGAFVLPSRFEPWGVVVAEAAAAGLPVICTSVCGAGDDIIRPFYNGLIVPPDDVEALASAFSWIQQHESELSQMGSRGRSLAEPYSAAEWATRWHNYFLKIVVASPEQSLQRKSG